MEHAFSFNLILWRELVPYCLGQAPMATRSSSTKNWGWAVTWGGAWIISAQAPTLDAKLAARVFRINLHLLFTHALGQPDGAGSCIVLQADQLISLPGFCSIRCLQYANFVLWAKNAVNKGMYGRCVRNIDTFIAGCCGALSVSKWSQLCTWAQRTYFWFSPQII